MITTSAPAKIILFGEHAVNRRQPAIATALDVRTRCTLKPRPDSKIILKFDSHSLETDCETVQAFTQTINALREAQDRTALRAQARDFFAPVQYVFGTFAGRYGACGAQVTWQSEIPAGSGLGSGAAASASLVMALARANRCELTTHEMAEIAWHGDIIAHGGIASGLDTSASTFGGVILYTLADSATPLSFEQAPVLVVGDTGVRANTAQVNARVSDWLAGDPERVKIFEQFGKVAREAKESIAQNNWQRVGELMNENHALLGEIGVSSPELETLVNAVRHAGALGAKLAGAGGGGVMVALTTPAHQMEIAQAIENAGGRALAVRAAVQGVREE